MRLRVHKRKVLLLALALAACALALWGSAGRATRRDPPATATRRPGSPPAAAAAALNASATSEPAAASAPAPGPGPTGGVNATWLRALVYRRNFEQRVLGAGRFPRAEVALVVQVHTRAEHLRLLLGSLRRARGVERALLVLSHDVWSAELEALARAVDFCAVLQVFFPFSLQLYPHEFPGRDPRDCPRDLGVAAARRTGCLNAAFPDAFGHYREAPFAQAKHHWWWKLHFLWGRVRALRDLPGPIVFLEEDHYVAPDFLHVLAHLQGLQQQQCPDCQVLALGGYGLPGRRRGGGGEGEAAAFAGRSDKVELKTWRSTEHNMGMAFGRDTYQQLRACADAFCTYDDYNWDWTLQHLTVACLPRFWKVLVPEVPRVFHTGDDCGMHHKQACQPGALVAKVDALLDANRQHLFPDAMSISKRYPLAPVAPHVKNGGWGDIRDHELCKSYHKLQ